MRVSWRARRNAERSGTGRQDAWLGRSLRRAGPAAAWSRHWPRDCCSAWRLIGAAGLQLRGVGGDDADRRRGDRAPALVVVESNIKKVQHPSGGIVAEILVKNGDRVSAGDVVLKLDDTQARANLGVITSQLVQLTGRKARLEAERDQADAIQFPGRRSWPAARRRQRSPKARSGCSTSAAPPRRARWRSSTSASASSGRRSRGMTAQREAKTAEVELMVEELDRLEQSAQEGADGDQPHPGGAARPDPAEGRVGRAGGADRARAAARSARPSCRSSRSTRPCRPRPARSCARWRRRVAELVERKIAAEDQLKRIVMRAPQTGIVHDLAVHTVGGRDRAGRERDDDRAGAGRARHRGAHRHLRHRPGARGPAGEPALPRLQSAHDARDQGHRDAGRRRPDARGADQHGATTWPASAPRRTARAKLKLIPGMPVEAFIATGERTAISYLVKPITDQFARAFRER